MKCPKCGVIMESRVGFYECLMCGGTVDMRIKCPWGLGDKTREECGKCRFCCLGDCPVGAYFVNQPENRRAYAEHIASGR